jgi:hypothetical protein
MAHLLNFPGDIKSNPVDASKMVVLKPTEKDIVLPDIKMHIDDEMLISLYHMDSQVGFKDGFTDQLNGMCVKTTDDHKITAHNAITSYYGSYKNDRHWSFALYSQDSQATCVGWCSPGPPTYLDSFR